MTRCSLARIYAARANSWLCRALAYEALRTEDCTVAQRRAYRFLEREAHRQALAAYTRLFRTESECR